MREQLGPQVEQDAGLVVARIARHAAVVGIAGLVSGVLVAGLGGRRDAVSEAVMRREVSRPRAIIETRLGIVPASMSYVGGGFTATLRRLVREAGYTTARSILRGSTQLEGRRYALRVVRIGSGTDVVDVVRGTLVPGLPRFTRLMQRGG